MPYCKSYQGISGWLFIVKAHHFKNDGKKFFCEHYMGGRIHNTLFSSQLNIKHNRIEYHDTLKWKALPGRNVLAYWENW